MTLGTKDAGITSVSTLTGASAASATAKTAVMPRKRKEPFFLAACSKQQHRPERYQQVHHRFYRVQCAQP